MARQTFTIGRPSASNLHLRLRWLLSPRPLINAGLRAAATQTSYLARFQLSRSTQVNTLSTSSTTSGSSTLSGPELSEAWEIGDRSIIINAGSLSLALPGPNNPAWATSDPNEPYNFTPTTEQLAAQTAFATAYLALSQAEREAATLTLDDGVERTGSVSVDTGSPTVAISADRTSPQVRSASISVATGATNIAVSAARIAKRIALASILTGAPAVSVVADRTVPQTRVASVSINTGVPATAISADRTSQGARVASVSILTAAPSIATSADRTPPQSRSASIAITTGAPSTAAFATRASIPDPTPVQTRSASIAILTSAPTTEVHATRASPSTPTPAVGQEIPIGTPTSEEAVQLEWEVSQLVDASLVPPGSGNVYLRRLRIGSSQNVRLDFADSPTGDYSAAGPELTEAFEGYVSAITVVAGSEQLVLPGPGSLLNAFPWHTDPYFWTSPTTINIQTFIADFRALSAADKAATQLTLSDGTQPTTPGQSRSASISINTGVPTVEIQATRSAGIAPTGVHINTIPPKPNEVARFLITAEESNKWYSRFSGEDIGEVEGDVRLFAGAQNLDIDRVWAGAGSNNDFRINRNPAGAAYGTNADLNIYFGAGGLGEGKVICVAVGDEILAITLDQIRSIGPHYINLTPTAAQSNVLNTVATGDKINIVIADDDAAPQTRQASVSISTGVPTAEAHATRGAVAQRTGTVVVRTGALRVNAQAERVLPTRSASIVVVTGTPIASIQADRVLPVVPPTPTPTRSASVAAVTGAPIVSIQANRTPPVTPIGVNLNTIPPKNNEVARFLITTEETNNWYSSFGIQDIGTIEGDRRLFEGTQNLDIDRLWWTSNANNDLRINRNPANVAYGTDADLNRYFGADGPGAGKSICVAIGDAIIEITLSQVRSIGPHYINLTPTAAQIAVFNTVVVGSKINVVIADSSIQTRLGTVAVATGAPVVSIQATRTPPVIPPPVTPTRSASLSIVTGAPTASVQANRVPPTAPPVTPVRSASLAIATGAPLAFAQATRTPPIISTPDQSIILSIGRELPLHSNLKALRTQSRFAPIAAQSNNDFQAYCPSKRILIGERLFPFAGFDYIGNFRLVSASWRTRDLATRDFTAPQPILQGQYTDILSALRFFSQTITSFGKYTYRLDVRSEFGERASIIVNIVCAISAGSDKTAVPNVPYRPFSDFRIAHNIAHINHVDYDVIGDAAVARTQITPQVKFEGKHEVVPNSQYMFDGMNMYTLADIVVGSDVIENVTDGSSGVVSGILHGGHGLSIQGLGLSGGTNNNFSIGDQYRIRAGNEWGTLVSEFELIHGVRSTNLVRLFVSDSSNRVSSAAVGVTVR